ncbi:MAG TPA: sigma-54-dependent Fis family transcriptional regulator [Desulfobacterales bacterium]|nr:sigma-54-dependent Fis family transcriptional regulator [Desulfobacterales bacterium]
MPNILIIDDELSMREFLKVLLEKEGYRADTAANAQDALAAVEGRDYDLIISDIKMPEISGIEFLEQIRSAGLTIPVILITAYASPEDAVAAMKGGAYDYITKPFNVAEIKEIVHSALLTARNTAAQPAGETFQGIIAQSPEMLKIFDLIRRISPTHANVLIQGESGTGKELVAHAVHNLSKAADHAFVPIICNAIPENLFESEVFGHVKGSFTGAVGNKQGLFAEADGGSVFLDEVGELSPLVQTKLLRVIQEREFKPVGGSHNIKVNIRVITATNRNLEQEVIAGRFREDLFYRLSVVPIRVPPLRERKGDVPLLVDYFLKKYSRLFAKEISALSSYSMEVLMNYDFPGNVRELENIIERGVAMESSNIILPESLSIASHRQAAQSRQGSASADDDFALGLEQAVENLERRLLRKAMEQAGGSKMKAAELLKISFRSLRYKIKKYGISNEKR